MESCWPAPGPLAPGPWFNSVTRDEYERLFSAQLAALAAQQVWDRLHALVAPHEPVLLWRERKAPVECGATWCHRHMVAAWFQRELKLHAVEF